MRARSGRFVLLAFVSFFALAVAGCGGAAKAKATVEQQSNVRVLAMLYGMYTSQHQGKGPTDEAAFKAFVAELPAERRANKDAAGLFTSERDGKPLVVIYGTLTGPPGPAGFPVCIYEQEGRGGKRYVATSVGALEEVDEARFKQLVPAAK